MYHARVGTGDVNNPEHDLGLVDRLPGALDAHPLDGIARLADACRVNEAVERTAHNHGVLDGVARGAVDVAHQGTVVTQQGIQQGRFSRIGLSHDGDRQAVADGVTVTVTVGQAADQGVDVARQGCHLATVGKGHILLAEIQFQLDERHKVQQFVTQGLEFVAVAPAHLAHRHLVGRP